MSKNKKSSSSTTASSSKMDQPSASKKSRQKHSDATVAALSNRALSLMSRRRTFGNANAACCFCKHAVITALRASSDAYKASSWQPEDVVGGQGMNMTVPVQGQVDPLKLLLGMNDAERGSSASVSSRKTSEQKKMPVIVPMSTDEPPWTAGIRPADAPWNLSAGAVWGNTSNYTSVDNKDARNPYYPGAGRVNDVKADYCSYGNCEAIRVLGELNEFILPPVDVCYSPTKELPDTFIRCDNVICTVDWCAKNFNNVSIGSRKEGQTITTSLLLVEEQDHGVGDEDASQAQSDEHDDGRQEVEMNGIEVVEEENRRLRDHHHANEEDGEDIDGRRDDEHKSGSRVEEEETEVVGDHEDDIIEEDDDEEEVENSLEDSKRKEVQPTTEDVAVVENTREQEPDAERVEDEHLDGRDVSFLEEVSNTRAAHKSSPTPASSSAPTTPQSPNSTTSPASNGNFTNGSRVSTDENGTIVIQPAPPTTPTPIPLDYRWEIEPCGAGPMFRVNASDLSSSSSSAAPPR
ncbi:unnamed protein product [Amoebophrya sp. A25]|nr:unnamed protein product [Amoebophrya sp. A25]|eukprot:GSA25T00024250001.1